MTFAIKLLARFLRLFRRNEDGNPTVEFTLVFLPFIILPVSGFELGLLMTRHVMMERGIDMAVRQVRLNTGTPITEQQFKTMICNAAAIIPDCMTMLRLELRPIDLRHSGSESENSIPREASCTDLSYPFQPARNFQSGIANEMMIVRACGKFVPMLPEFGLGYFLSRMDGGYYRLVSTTAFVMEPA
ncbi:hypothetical protein OAN307_c11260 [Octadecabacter antarcticus 307]|uniref:TadE-like protein n=1 Tax=Octadecabacter antarcticus 307 TaxID=391626 RepID=M9R4Y4_9RHOB|nr:TadE/TadG family type IV pilus assembly protein [Octadecabacter antarcticus]AGI66828.1 hypothetical protein OAN307_c11260 [Octadecabacter antarcticus 307]